MRQVARPLAMSSAAGTAITRLIRRQAVSPVTPKVRQLCALCPLHVRLNVLPMRLEGRTDPVFPLVSPRWSPPAGEPDQVAEQHTDPLALLTPRGGGGGQGRRADQTEPGPRRVVLTAPPADRYERIVTASKPPVHGSSVATFATNIRVDPTTRQDGVLRRGGAGTSVLLGQSPAADPKPDGTSRRRRSSAPRHAFLDRCATP
jgi:hypothetical protein